VLLLSMSIAEACGTVKYTVMNDEAAKRDAVDQPAQGCYTAGNVLYVRTVTLFIQDDVMEPNVSVALASSRACFRSFRHASCRSSQPIWAT